MLAPIKWPGRCPGGLVLAIQPVVGRARRITHSKASLERSLEPRSVIATFLSQAQMAIGLGGIAETSQEMSLGRDACTYLSAEGGLWAWTAYTEHRQSHPMKRSPIDEGGRRCAQLC